MVSGERPGRAPRRHAFVPAVPRRRSRTLRRRAAGCRPRARDPRQAGGAGHALDLGRVQDAGTRVPRAARAVAGARTARRIHRHAGERVARARRSRNRRESRRNLSRRRHARRLSRGDAHAGRAARGRNPGHIQPICRRSLSMIEAAMLWNEPNNKSHWDPEVDPDWSRFAEMATLAGRTIQQTNPSLTRVLGGISPIDPQFIRGMQARGVLNHVDAIAVHGFPLDWNHWQIEEWPDRLAEIQCLTSLPVWVSEVGVSSFGSDEVQAWGLDRTAELLAGRAPRVHWYSLYDLPRAWEATTRHKEAEGSSYYRHFHMGLLREDGTPKPALERFRQHAGELGICQWFHFRDP